jgi:hypothetical protein
LGKKRKRVETRRKEMLSHLQPPPWLRILLGCLYLKCLILRDRLQEPKKEGKFEGILEVFK